MYTFLDYFFILFHGSLVIFDLTGWAWRKDTTHTFDNYWPNYLVLVRFRSLLRLGLLPLYGLALGGQA